MSKSLKNVFANLFILFVQKLLPQKLGDGKWVDFVLHIVFTTKNYVDHFQWVVYQEDV